ncbi:R3H and coiled-coil domain-containing protein 1 [Pleurodeles waltl]|uniref:R3H and coiled-coil domain-containing protein 1 n=1 Tax=Pleurodeles waltl TaxID=8319 RepID=UPI0037098DE5
MALLGSPSKEAVEKKLQSNWKVRNEMSLHIKKPRKGEKLIPEECKWIFGLYKSALSDSLSTVTLATSYCDDVYLNGSEKEFYSTVTEELEQFLHEKNQKKVLLFPPLPNRLRFLTHRITENFDGLSSFSVGERLTRRTVVCHVDIRILGEGNHHNRDAPGFNNYRKQRGGRSGREGASERTSGGDGIHPFRPSRGRGRKQFNKRPDKPLYVPAGVRQKYGTWVSSGTEEPEIVTYGADKEAVCNDLIVKPNLENECNERYLHEQVTERSAKVSNCEPMDLSHDTLEDKSTMEEMMDTKQVALEKDVTELVGEPMGMIFYTKALDISKTAVEDNSSMTDVTKQGGETVQMNASCKTLEISKPTEDDHIVADISESVMEAVEDCCNALDLGKAALESGRSGASICEQLAGLTTELNYEALDVSRSVISDAGTVLDIPDAMNTTVASEAKCHGNVQMCKNTTADEKVLVKHATVDAPVEIEVSDTHQAATQNVKLTSSVPVHVGETVTKTMGAGGVNQAVLKVENSVLSNKTIKEDCEDEVLNVKQLSPEAERRVFAFQNPNEDCIEIKSKTSDELNTNALLTVSDMPVEDRPVAGGLRVSKDLAEQHICIGDMSEENVEDPPQTSLTLNTSDSKCISHNTVHKCPLEGSNTLQNTERQTDQSITSSAECQNADINAEISMPLPELLNKEIDAARVPCEANHATSSSVSGTSVEPLTGNEDQEIREDEDYSQQLLQEIKTHLTEKDISIEKLKFDYSSYGVTVGGMVKFTHVIEIYDFIPDLNTEDIMGAFTDFQKSEFRLQWVDSTHALGLFSTEEAANKALAMIHPLLKFRPLFEASNQSKNKAYQCIDAILPYKERPQTDTTVAKRFLNRALGLPRKRKSVSEDMPPE